MFIEHSSSLNVFSHKLSGQAFTLLRKENKNKDELSVLSKQNINILFMSLSMDNKAVCYSTIN